MKLEERLLFCKKCENRTYDVSLGTICSLSNEIPLFKKECSEFSIDEFEEKIIQNTLKNAIPFEKEEFNRTKTTQQMSLFNINIPKLLNRKKKNN